MSDPRDDFIARVCKGKSFIDIGGIWEIVKERISVAHAAGASKLTLMDVIEISHPAWQRMRQRLTGLGVHDCEFISGDVQTQESLDSHDVVFSSGVLYHLPSPFVYLERLRALTREHCILTSSTCPRRIVVDSREMTVPDAGVLFIPALTGPERELVVEWYARRGRDDISFADDGFGGHRNLRNYAPNWFMPTVPVFREMARCAGFEIIDEAPVEPDELSHCLLLR